MKFEKYIKKIYGKRVMFIFLKFPFSNGYFCYTKKMGRMIKLFFSPFALITGSLIIPLIYFFGSLNDVDYLIGVQYKNENHRKIILEHELIHLKIHEKLKKRKDLIELFHNQLDNIEWWFPPLK